MAGRVAPRHSASSTARGMRLRTMCWAISRFASMVMSPIWRMKLSICPDEPVRQDGQRGDLLGKHAVRRLEPAVQRRRGSSPRIAPAGRRTPGRRGCPRGGPRRRGPTARARPGRKRAAAPATRTAGARGRAPPVLSSSHVPFLKSTSPCSILYRAFVPGSWNTQVCSEMRNSIRSTSAERM